MFSIENATSIGKQAFDPHGWREGPSTNISVCLLTILPRSRSNGEEFCGVHEILKEYRRDQRESRGARMLSLIFHEISLVWQFELRCNQYSRNRNHLCVLLSIFWMWAHWTVYIYICEFNFVSRSIGKVGKVDLLKNDLWLWDKNILQGWNLKYRN